MTNREIARTFQFLGKIMELHGENPFKTRSYSSAYINIRKLPQELATMSTDDINSLPGVGKAISDKIQELLSTGELQTLNKFKEMTPEGIQDMLKIKGLGPKKVKLIWEELSIESAGELLYACNENRLVEVKGFGAKTQQQLITQLEYFFASKGKLHWATAESIALDLLSKLSAHYPERFIITGEIKRLFPIVETIEIITTLDLSESDIAEDIEDLFYDETKEQLSYLDCPVSIIASSMGSLGIDLLETSSSGDFLDALGNYESLETEEDIFEALELPYIPSELRDDEYILEEDRHEEIEDIVSLVDIKGVVHNHSTYSDGVNSVSQMAQRCIDLGYNYLVMSDHSKSAFYANGLKEDRVMQQWEEIDVLNTQWTDFKIFKSIESDILSSGELDYTDEILEGFDLIIASVHSNLKMDEDKATKRLIKAIENPYTRILGHPTGRLLLSRKGYPIDHQKVIDACAANNVVIELNANPHRLDIDYTWIPYATEKGVMIAINPDAHSVKGIEDIRYGVNAARKGFLKTSDCLNCLSLTDFEKWIAAK